MLPSPFQWVHTRIQRQGFPLVATEPGRNCGEGSPSIHVGLTASNILGSRSELHPTGTYSPTGQCRPRFHLEFL